MPSANTSIPANYTIMAADATPTANLSAVTLPDLITTTVGANQALILPKAGGPFAPLGSRVTIRKVGTANFTCTITAHVAVGAADATDTIDGAVSNATALTGPVPNQITLQVATLAAPVGPALVGVANWVTVASSIAGQ